MIAACRLPILLVAALAAAGALAQEAAIPADQEMALCHSGLDEIEDAYATLEDGVPKQKVAVIIAEIYRAQDRDEGGLCMSLIARARETLANRD